MDKTIEECLRLLASMIGDYILPHLKGINDINISDKIDSGWLNHAEAALYIKKTPAALYCICHDRKVKFTKRGKSNFYRREHLQEYMMAGMVKTRDEIIAETKFIPRKNNFLTKTK